MQQPLIDFHSWLKLSYEYKKACADNQGLSLRITRQRGIYQVNSNIRKLFIELRLWLECTIWNFYFETVKRVFKLVFFASLNPVDTNHWRYEHKHMRNGSFPLNSSLNVLYKKAHVRRILFTFLVFNSSCCWVKIPFLCLLCAQPILLKFFTPVHLSRLISCPPPLSLSSLIPPPPLDSISKQPDCLFTVRGSTWSFIAGWTSISFPDLSLRYVWVEGGNSFCVKYLFCFWNGNRASLLCNVKNIWDCSKRFLEFTSYVAHSWLK